MRRDLFDESKIIKKNDVIQIPQQIEDLSNIRSSITINHINNKLANQSENELNNVTISKQPVFIFAKDKNTNKIITTNDVKSKSINVKIPHDQLTIIFNNTKKYKNELLLEIELLKNFKNEDTNMINYCNNKISIYKDELKYVDYKINILSNILNRKE